MTSTIWTIGHSTRPWDEFLSLLSHYHIQAVVDVRRFPSSRRQPQYAQETLRPALARQNLAYCWLAELGGRRRPRPDSPNTAWRNTSFRGYADHMSSTEFANGLEKLVEFSSAQRTALMCAEAVWWRCHRALIADALSVRGIEIVHIMGATQTVVHPYTSPARILDGHLSYASTKRGSSS